MNRDKFDNNNATPTKRTDFKDDTNHDNDSKSGNNQGNVPEISNPNPSNATNDIPSEMPIIDPSGK
jgi:hypothetical protein